MSDYKDIMAATGKYQKDGQEKTAWTKVGMLMRKDNGSFAIKLEAVPVGGWDGWLQVFDRQPRNEVQQSRERPSAQTTPSFDDDIPW